MLRFVWLCMSMSKVVRVQKMCVNAQRCRGDVRVAREPPLCKGRWIAKQDGGIVSQNTASVLCDALLRDVVGAVPYRPSPSPLVPPVSSADSGTSREIDNQSFSNTLGFASLVSLRLGHLAALEHLVPFTTARPLRYAGPYRPSPSPAVPPLPE